MRSLFRVAADLQAFLQEQRWQFCFIGGIALQRWGHPRLTVDVDVSLLAGIGSEAIYIETLCAKYAGRIPDAREFALRNRVLLLQSDDGIPLDIALAAFPYEELVIQRATVFEFVEALGLRTCSAEDLIVLKAFADRARDWADVESIIARQQGSLDCDYILQHMAPLCEIKDSPTIFARLREMVDTAD